jgi:response regulator RpfG family c-di-GMP phosphodiesterase
MFPVGSTRVCLGPDYAIFQPDAVFASGVSRVIQYMNDKDTILFVDDEARILSALQRSLYREYRIEIAGSALDALEAMAERPYAVVVSDLRMPGMDGNEFLRRVKESSPETVRVLLTGWADLEAATSAVNEGSIFRFLTKPCPQELLTKTLDAALEQHYLITSSRIRLQETIEGTVAVLVKILGVVQPLAMRRASRIGGYVRQLGQRLQVADLWQVEAAARLSQIGWIGAEPEALERYYQVAQLSEVERTQALSYDQIGASLLGSARQLRVVAQMIQRQHESFSATCSPSVGTQAVAFGAQVLHAVLDFDRLRMCGRSRDAALAEMRSNPSDHNPDVLCALERIDLTEPDDKPEILDDPLASDPEVQLFRPIADEVLRAFRG